MRTSFILAAASLALILGGCNDESKLPPQASTGPSPTLPQPTTSFFPTVNIAPEEGWSAGARPKGAQGLAVEAFATQLNHPRWLYVLPNGDVLVAESNGPERPGDKRGIKAWLARAVQSWAGAGGKSP